MSKDSSDGKWRSEEREESRDDDYRIAASAPTGREWRKENPENPEYIGDGGVKTASNTLETGAREATIGEVLIHLTEDERVRSGNGEYSPRGLRKAAELYLKNRSQEYEISIGGQKFSLSNIADDTSAEKAEEVLEIGTELGLVDRKQDAINFGEIPIEVTFYTPNYS